MSTYQHPPGPPRLRWWRRLSPLQWFALATAAVTGGALWVKAVTT